MDVIKKTVFLLIILIGYTCSLYASGMTVEEYNYLKDMMTAMKSPTHVMCKKDKCFGYIENSGDWVIMPTLGEVDADKGVKAVWLNFPIMDFDNQTQIFDYSVVNSPENANNPYIPQVVIWIWEFAHNHWYLYFLNKDNPAIPVLEKYGIKYVTGKAVFPAGIGMWVKVTGGKKADDSEHYFIEYDMNMDLPVYKKGVEMGVFYYDPTQWHLFTYFDNKFIGKTDIDWENVSVAPDELLYPITIAWSYETANKQWAVYSNDDDVNNVLDKYGIKKLEKFSAWRPMWLKGKITTMDVDVNGLGILYKFFISIDSDYIKHFKN